MYRLKFFKLTIAAFALLLAISSCSNKAAFSTISYENVKAKEVVQILDTLNVEFDELKARFRVNADMNGQSRSFNADLRWMADQKIWMSFSIFGFEGVRALFTPDSVKIINKLQKEYYYGTYESLEQLSQIQLSFDQLEDLFLGKLTGIQDKRPEVRFKGDAVILELQDKEYQAKVQVDKKTLSIQHYLITSLLDFSTLDVTLSDYQTIDNKNWANKRNYNLKSGGKYLSIDATSQKVVLNEKLEYPFYINQSYTQKPLHTFR